MALARDKIEALSITLRSHIITVSRAPGTSPEYLATLEQLKIALWEHTDITREIIPLEDGEEEPNERLALSRAIAKSMQTDNMIVNFVTDYCDDEGHFGALVNNRMATNSMTDMIVVSTKILKATVHEYKKRNDRL